MAGRLDLRTLTAFVTVAREGNVSRAADLLHLTQPAVSLQLRRLAEDTGLTLFRRSARGLDLTPDGRALLVKAQLVLQAMEDLGQTARRLTRTVGGTLRIGTVIDPAFIRLGDFLQGLLQLAPELRPELSHGMSGQVLRDLARERLEVAFFLGPIGDFTSLVAAEPGLAEADFAIRELTRFRYLVLAPAGWEARLRGQGWAGLARLPWIGTPPESVHHRLLERVLVPLGVAQNVVTLADQEGSMLELVRAGLGLSLSRESTALHERQVHGLAIAEGVGIETQLSFVALARRAGDPRIALAMEVIDRVFNDPAAAPP